MCAFHSGRDLRSMSEIDCSLVAVVGDSDGVHHSDAVHGARLERLFPNGKDRAVIGEQYLRRGQACVVARLPDAYLLLCPNSCRAQ